MGNLALLGPGSSCAYQVWNSELTPECGTILTLPAVELRERGPKRTPQDEANSVQRLGTGVPVGISLAVVPAAVYGYAVLIAVNHAHFAQSLKLGGGASMDRTGAPI